MTPDAVEERYGVPPERYPELAAIVGETSDNLPGVPGVGPGLRGQVAQRVRRPRGRHHPRRRDHRQEGRGAARAPRRRHPQPPAQRAGPRPRPRAAHRPTSRPQSWDRQLVHTLFDSLEFRVLRERLLESWDVQHDDIDDSGFELAGATLGGRRGRRLAGRARRRADAHRADRARRLGRRHRRGARAGAGRGRRPGGLDRRRRGHARGRRRRDDVARRPQPGQGAPRRQGPDAGSGRARLAARAGWSATPPSRPTSCAPTSAPTTWPT